MLIVSGELFCKDRPRYKSKVPRLTNPNSRFPSLSSSVSVVRNSEVGRHVVAERDIRAGELIAVEDPVKIVKIKFPISVFVEFGFGPQELGGRKYDDTTFVEIALV